MKIPRPLMVWTSEIGTDDGGTLTAINRVWREADAARCELCPQCVRVPILPPLSACTVAVNVAVNPDSAAGFSLRG